MSKSNTTLDGLAVMIEKGFEHVDERFEHVDERFERVEQRFDRMETRLETLEKGQQALFAAVRELPSPEAFLRLRKDLASLSDRVAPLEVKGSRH